MEELKEPIDIEETAGPVSDETTALAIKATDLDNESKELINQIIAESDIEKTKDLTYLFNVNQNKKTMVRMDKLSGLQDNLVDQFARRISERPDEISNKELMDGIKIVQDIIERGQKQVAGVNEAPAPLIQINQQTNSVNVGDSSANLNRESREKVKNAVMSLLKGITTPQAAPTQPSDNIIEAEVIEDDL